METNNDNIDQSVTSKGIDYPTITEDEWMPFCDDELKPIIGKVFDTLKEGEEFYKRYAHSVGFSVRSSSETKDKNGVKRWKYFVCSKEGFKASLRKEVDIAQTGLLVEGKNVPKTRKRNLTREGCNAKVVFKLTMEGKYELVRFYEGHTHALATPRKRQFLRSARNINSIHKNLLHTYNRANVGTSKVYQLLKEQVGGYENVGCTQRDFQNYSRDLKALIKDSDAHMFIDNFKRKQETNHSFYYAYDVDDEGRLKSVFWADGLCRKIFSLFGDVVSFDTTYETNKYCMIFAPFTGINHHRQSITFGAGFLADEKVESFVWLFERFLEAMGDHQPIVIITDQDPAMKIAMEKVFCSSTHRYCMWHIMKKVSEKVGASLNANDDFNNRFKSCVWNSETPKEFESTWKLVISDFGLEKNDWLTHMYNIRSMWIPAYFKNLFLVGILRTTSRSESENSFYGHFLNKNLSLVEFWMRFDCAIEAQRHKELLADNNTLHSIPQLKMNRSLEKHGRDIYTQENFYIFQKELWIACMDCGVEEKREEEGMSKMTVIDNSAIDGKLREVIYNVSYHIAHCSCKMFESEGIPCRHILFVLKGKGLNEIPNHYLVNRWTKLATSQPIFDDKGNILEGCSKVENVNKLISDEAGRCEEKLNIVKNGALDIEKQLIEANNDFVQGKKEELEYFFESHVPVSVEIHPPQLSKTKGSGRRIKGGKEKAIEQQQKRTRLCKACGQYGYHDSRNCPTKYTS